VLDGRPDVDERVTRDKNVGIGSCSPCFVVLLRPVDEMIVKDA
jgi:hypothetical protein